MVGRSEMGRDDPIIVVFSSESCGMGSSLKRNITSIFGMTPSQKNERTGASPRSPVTSRFAPSLTWHEKRSARCELKAGLGELHEQRGHGQLWRAPRAAKGGGGELHGRRGHGRRGPSSARGAGRDGGDGEGG